MDATHEIIALDAKDCHRCGKEIKTLTVGYDKLGNFYCRPCGLAVNREFAKARNAARILSYVEDAQAKAREGGPAFHAAMAASEAIGA